MNDFNHNLENLLRIHRTRLATHVAAPLGKEELEHYFGTEQPTKEMISRRLDFLASIERGHCVYFTVFADGRPSELFFAGYSFD